MFSLMFRLVNLIGPCRAEIFIASDASVVDMFTR